jgi:outer membrane protein assembly factor BamB/tetratricopeptide (TPR) repeat protein
VQTSATPTSAKDLEARLLGGNDPLGAEVTMRGDLQQMSVSDIFQTLVMSKMEGMLRIRNPLEQHLLFFNSGFVQDVIPHRIENRRLGERLIRAGMLQKEQLRDMLTLQKQTGLTLGQLLVREGLVTQQAVEDVAYYQAAEDLYSLFTWRDGTFEFFKGPCTDPEHLELLKVLPRFEGTLILLEVARRSDEWEPILETLHSVDELIVMLRDRGDEAMQDNHLLVLESVDGHRTIRELAETTLLSLFDCARAIRDLHRWGIVGLAVPEEILETARSHIDHNKSKRAVAILRALLQREDPIEPDVVREVAALLHRCGEMSMAGQGLVDAARKCSDPAVARELVREAYRLDPRSIDALGLLLEHLLMAGEEGEELHEVSCALADAFTEQGRSEEALEVIALLETSAPDNSSALIRKARILQRLGRGEDAIEELLRLAEKHKAEGRVDRLALIYEQVLKIDFRRKDVAKALRALRTSALQRRLRLAGLAGAALATCGGLWWWYAAGVADARRAQLTEDVTARLTAQDTQGAMALVNGAIGAVDDDAIDELRRRVDAAIAEERAKLAREEYDARRAKMARAADHIDQGQLDAGLSIYAGLLGAAQADPEVQKVVQTRVGSLSRRLQDLAGELEKCVPPAPDPLVQSESERRSVLRRLQENFQEVDLRRAQGVVTARDSETLATLLGVEDRNRLVAAAERLITLYHEADKRQRQYLALQTRSETEKRLQPTFTAAESLLEKFQFREALTAYRKLAEEYPADNDFKAHFRQQVERLEAITATLDALAAATKRGDFTTARGQLQYLKTSQPEVPFESLVELPLRIATMPEGATAYVNGRLVGTTPVLASYRPIGTKEIKLVLDGFEPASVTFEGDSRGDATLVLARQPDWTLNASGSIERAAAIDPQGRAFLVDRSGAITAVQIDTGLPLWTHQTNDMSGLLPTPIVWEDRLIVCSLDGAVTCLDRKSAERIWKRFGLPCEATPVLAGTSMFAATTGGKLAALDPATGKERFALDLPGPVSADLCTDGARVFANTTNGWAVAVDAGDGALRWKVRIADSIVAAPACAGDRVLVAADGGRLACLKSASGEVLWSLSGLGEMLLEPAITDRYAIVAADRWLRAFDLRNGDPGPALEGEQRWSSAPVHVAGRILVGDHQGAVLVLGCEELGIRYRLRGRGKVSAPASADSKGRVVVGFENRTVLGFRELR